MSDPMRVPLRPKGASFLSNDDIAASIGASPNLKYGRRFSLDIAEDALAQMGAEVVPFVMNEVAKSIAMREHHATHTALYREYLHDRTWMEPVIKEALLGIIREYVVECFQHLDLSMQIRHLDERLKKLEAPDAQA